MNFVKVISSIIDSFGVKVKFQNKGRDDVRETEQISPAGFESRPVKDMMAIYMKTQQDGDDVIIGYLVKDAIVDVGESRMFSTDSSGQLQFAIHLRNDGTAEIGGDSDFMVRFSELKNGFDALKSDFNTFVTTYNTHVHPSPAGGSTGTTPATGSPSGASIDACKIDEIKTI